LCAFVTVMLAAAVGLALLLALFAFVALRAQPPSAAAGDRAAPLGPPPEVPPWAQTDLGARIRAAAHARNVRAAAQTTAYDFVLFGDSITSRINESGDCFAVFRKYFGQNAAALGVGGDKVEDLAWRVMRGGEKPRRDPRVVALMIGVNNLNTGSDPAPRLDVVLGWMRAAMPTSSFVVCAILPNKYSAARVPAANERYKALAAKHGCAFAPCGQDIAPGTRALLVDGIHPSAAGYDRVFACLKAVVK
jgi:lysophospholipase L1-like esterase